MDEMRLAELNGLREAALILEARKLELATGEPFAVWQVVAHAATAVNNRLAAMLRGAE